VTTAPMVDSHRYPCRTLVIGFFSENEPAVPMRPQSELQKSDIGSRFRALREALGQARGLARLL